MAKPRPTITWHRVELNQSRTILAGTEEGVLTIEIGDTERDANSTLVFFPTRPSLSAIYICDATNPVSSSEANASLTVFGKPCNNY